MPSQSELIGDHPSAPNQFQRWLLCNDVPVTLDKIHRALSSKIATEDIDLIEWLARQLIKHHHPDYHLDMLKEKYGQLGFPLYAEQNRKLPRADKTKKGNGAEVILIEYICSSLDTELLKAFKLKYNPNVDQAMKGDDALIVKLFNEEGRDQVKVYFGEAKFRATPSKAVIEEIINSLGKEKKPLSYSFLIAELARDPNTIDFAKRLDKFIIDEIKGNNDLIYTGLLLSNTDTFNKVEEHLSSDNQSFLFISIGIENPENLISKAFEKAEEIILGGQI
jgi:hypothetical protein